MNCITTSCVIGGHVVVKNGKTVFGGGAGMDSNGRGRVDLDGADRERSSEGGTGEVSGRMSVGERVGVGDFLQAVYQYTGVNYPRFYKMDNLSKLGWLAAEILLQDGFQCGNYRPEEVGIVLANANASLDTDLKYFDTVREFPSPSLFVYTLPNIMIGEICIRKGFRGENAFFISDRFDAGLVAGYVDQLLDNDILQTCICGWVDLLGGEYKAALFLVEKRKDVGAVLANGSADSRVAFTAAAMNKLFSGKNGEVNG